MDIINLMIMFFIIIIFIKYKKPLCISILISTFVGIVLYKLSLDKVFNVFLFGITSRTTIEIVLAFYSITFLQRMLEKRNRLEIAEKSISKIFNSNRVNATLVPFIIGLLPSAGAMLIAAPIVKNASEKHLDKEEQAFVTTYFRHISEAFVPTYSSVILGLRLSGQDMGLFVLLMLPMIALLFLLGYVFYVRKIPKLKKENKSVDYKKEWYNVFRSLWSIVLTVAIILIFRLPIPLVVFSTIILNFVVDKFTFKEIRPFFISAFESKLIFTTVTIMIFKEFLTIAGVVGRLPYYFMNSNLKPEIIFIAVFLLGTIVVGSQPIIAIIMPIAYASIPNASIGLLVILMSMTYIGMQICPTHICLSIVTEEFKVSFESLVKKTIPIMVIFVILANVYGFILMKFFGG